MIFGGLGLTALGSRRMQNINNEAMVMNKHVESDMIFSDLVLP